MKKGSKSGLLKALGPILGFYTKKSPGIEDPRISWLHFGTKNHKMRGPPVAQKNFGRGITNGFCQKKIYNIKKNYPDFLREKILWNLKE